MNRIVAIILAIVLSVVSATAGIRHYCDTTPAISGLTIQGTPDYSTSYSYDLNGNPTRIYRKGISHKYASGNNRQWQYDEIDNLYIDYRGNQVNFTDDSCPWGYYEDAPGYIEESYDDNEYTWDANGNMTKDLNRGISSIQYNLQNQPTRIAYNDRHYENRLYNSLGEKLRTIHTVLVTSATSSSTSTTTLVTENKRDYYGTDLVYRNDTLEMVLTDNGYVDASGNYHYYVLDYQGNVRQVVDAQGNVLEQNDYYPYGGLFGESASRQSYKYSGKELETMNGLNTYDFHARPYYYPVLQFHSPDILSEEKPWNSPYLYCSGNPINRIDPSGMADYFNQKGKYITTIDDGIDVRMMLFTNSTNIEDAQKAISEKLYTPVPSEEVIKAMEQVYEQTEKTGNEAGFIVGQNGTVSRIVEGISGEIDNETWRIAQKDIADKNDKISYDVHSHPEQKVSEYKEEPSPEDKQYIVGDMPGALLGYDIKTYISNGYLRREVFRSVKRAIIFYNPNGVLYRQEFSKFKKTIKNINSK